MIETSKDIWQYQCAHVISMSIGAYEHLKDSGRVLPSICTQFLIVKFRIDPDSDTQAAQWQFPRAYHLYSSYITANLTFLGGEHPILGCHSW